MIQEHALPLSKIQSGEPIITHNGAEYNATLEEGTTLHSIQVFLPTETGDKYELMKQPIAQALHIKRVTRLNPAAAATAAVSAPATGIVPRPQPAGLKARFYPIGASPAALTDNTGKDADSDVDMAEAVPAKSSSKKRKSETGSEDAPAKKTKKTKEPKEAKETKTSKKAKSETPIAPPAVPGAAATKKTSVTPKKVTPILPPTIPGSKSKSS